jgi:hypothetical protein
MPGTNELRDATTEVAPEKGFADADANATRARARCYDEFVVW